MAQFAVPIADTSTTGVWSPQSGSDLFAMVDEAVANDADYAQAPCGPLVGPVVRWKLSAVTDPTVSSGYLIRWRAHLDYGPVITVTQTVRLYEGATLKVTEVITLNGGQAPFSEYTRALTTGEADSLSNHGDLYLEFEHQLRDASPVVQISLARLEVPDAGFAHLDMSGSGLGVAAVASGFHLRVSNAGMIRVAGIEAVGSALVLHSGVGYKVAS